MSGAAGIAARSRSSTQRTRGASRGATSARTLDLPVPLAPDTSRKVTPHRIACRCVYLGTTEGIHRVADGAVEPLGLAGERIMAVHDDGDVVLAGSYGHGLFRSADAGGTWTRVEAGLTASA